MDNIYEIRTVVLGKDIDSDLIRHFPFVVQITEKFSIEFEDYFDEGKVENEIAKFIEAKTNINCDLIITENSPAFEILKIDWAAAPKLDLTFLEND